MERPVVAHPADETLVSYGLGKLDETISDAIDLHLAQCPPCRERVAELSSDSFVHRLRAAQPGAVNAAGPAQDSPQDAIETVKLPPVGPPPSALPPDLVNHPQYEVVRELGRGGMGVVYLARNKLMNRLEVLKILNKDVLARRGTVDRFLREIQSAGKLNHQNIVTAYSALQIGDVLVFAMEYVEGDDLSKLVKTRGPLPVVNACYFTMQAAQGLQHAHERGMIHRDIKPHNLMLAREGKRATVKILDFGLAKITSEREVDGALTHEGQMLGTPDYIAPEQTLEAKQADIRADIYSLGCTLYYLLAGSPPFRGASLYEILLAHQSRDAQPLNLVRPEVPVELAAVVGKMMAKDVSHRYQTPAEVVQALKTFIKPKAKTAPEPAASSPDVELSKSGRIELPKSAGIQSTLLETPADKALAPPVKPSPAKSAPAEGGWDSSLDISELERSSPRLGALLKKSPKQLQRGKRPPARLWPAIAVVGLCLALIGLWGAGVLRVTTKDGIIVLQDLPTDASVFVDGQTVNVQWKDDGSPAQITVPPGKRGVEVKKDGFTTFGEDVTLSKGERKLLTVKLEPLPPPIAGTDSKKLRYINQTYDGTIRFVNGEWEGVNNKTGVVGTHYKEVSRNDEFVELVQLDRNLPTRLYADHIEQKLDGKWSNVARGRWEAPVGATDATSRVNSQNGEDAASVLEKAKSEFASVISKADDQLLAQFDAKIAALVAAKLEGQTAAIVDAMKSEKSEFTQNRRFPWSQPMREPLIEYIKLRRQAEANLQNAFAAAIDNATTDQDEAALAKLNDEKQFLLSPHSVGKFRAVGTNFNLTWVYELYSDGSVNPQITSTRTWQLEGESLLINLLDPRNPQREITDQCVVSPDGKTLKATNTDGGKYTAQFIE